LFAVKFAFAASCSGESMILGVITPEVVSKPALNPNLGVGVSGPILEISLIFLLSQGQLRCRLSPSPRLDLIEGFKTTSI